MDGTMFDKLIRGKNINFLIGSGASASLYPTLSLGPDCPSFEDVVCHENISDETKIFMYLYYFRKAIVSMAVGRKEFDEKYEKNKGYKQYKRFVELIYGFLERESNERPKRANIFSTNYDLLIERACDAFLMEHPLASFNDGSRGAFIRYISNQNFYLNVTHSGYNDTYRREVPTVNLIKLHGSVSWKVDQDKILAVSDNFHINLVKKKSDEVGISLEGGEKILEECREKSTGVFVEKLNETVSLLGLDLQKLKDFFIEYKELPIINPDKDKFYATVVKQHHYQMLRSFSYELEGKQAVLIVFGFSFADEHITDIFRRSLLNPELLVIIISYSLEEQEKHKNLFKGHENIVYLPKSYENQKGDFEFLLSLLGEYDA